jgi:integrase
LFEEAAKIDTRFAALLIVLCYTGMRLNEALRLKWNNVRLQEAYALVSQTKNDDPRGVFIPPICVAVIEQLPRGKERVFPFQKGGHLYEMLKTAAFKAGIDLPERSAFHLLRHCYASWMRRYAALDTKGLVATGAWNKIGGLPKRGRTRAERTAVVARGRAWAEAD